MSPDAPAAPRSPRAAKAGKPRAQGQWALGYREPLNPNERSKRDDNPLHVRARIEQIYSKRGFDSIDPADLRGRMRWYGLYTQRAEGIPGGRTAVLEPEELDAPYFMLRIRIDGGKLTSDQLRVVGDIATRYGRDVADVTDRQNVQLHWIRIEDVPAIWTALEGVGLSTTEACGDCPRVFLTCPLDGVAADEIVECGPAVDETVAAYVGDPQFSNLPRKFKTSISGCAHHCTNHEINDIAFEGVALPDGTAGFDLYVGGGLSTNPMFAERLGVFVRPDEVREVWAGVCGLFRDYGYRRSRNHARIKFLMADWGPEKFRQVLQDEYLHRELPDGPAVTMLPGPRDHVGVTEQKDGRFAVGAVGRAGRSSGETLTAIAGIADRFGSGRIRTTAQQGLVLLDVEASDVDAVVAALDDLGWAARPSAFRRGTIACTGIEFCKLAIVETKGRANWLRGELENRLPEFDTPVTINVNGCPNSCARFQVADLGFKGLIARGPDGEDVEAFQVHLGGELAGRAAIGRKFRGLKVNADDLPDYAERVLRGYLAHRTSGEESFADYVARADEEWLV